METHSDADEKQRARDITKLGLVAAFVALLAVPGLTRSFVTLLLVDAVLFSFVMWCMCILSCLFEERATKVFSEPWLSMLVDILGIYGWFKLVTQIPAEAQRYAVMCCIVAMISCLLSAKRIASIILMPSSVERKRETFSIMFDLFALGSFPMLAVGEIVNMLDGYKGTAKGSERFVYIFMGYPYLLLFAISPANFLVGRDMGERGRIMPDFMYYTLPDGVTPLGILLFKPIAIFGTVLVSAVVRLVAAKYYTYGIVGLFREQ